MSPIRPLSDDLQKVAIKKLNEVPERVPADIETLKAWIKQQPYLRARTDDQFLLAFLRGCKFSIEKAKTKIDRFYTLRSRYPELFGSNDVDDPKIRAALRLGIVLPLPTPLNGNGPRIVLTNAAYNPEKISVADITRLICLMQEIDMVDDDIGVVNGYVLLTDFAKLSTGHTLQLNPSAVKKMVTFATEAQALRFYGLHYINLPNYFDPIVKLAKPLVSRKISDRVHIHSGKFATLYDHVPKKYLPKEYGGTNGTAEEIIAIWEKKLDEYREFFKENEQYGTDEKLRPGKPIDFDCSFGLDGSFRKLNID